MNPNALKIGIVSEDPHLNLDVLLGLSNFGYEVISASGFKPLSESWETGPVDILLVDAGHPDLAKVGELPALGKNGFTYKILLYSADRPIENLKGLESAFNDAIVKPLNGGELLSRICAGVRFVEFERRHRKQSMFDRPTGLMSQRGLLKTIDKIQQSCEDSESQGFALVMLRLDFLDLFTETHGTEFRDLLLREVAQLLAKTAGEGEYVASLQNHNLALVIPDSSLEEGKAVAALLSDSLEQALFDIHGKQFKQTATLCVAAWETNSKPLRDVLTAAEKTLKSASILGGDTIVHCGQFDQELATWQEKNWAGIDLSQLTARDVMVPFTLQWDATEKSSVLEKTIVNSGVAYVPYLGEGDLYLGVLSCQTLKHQVLGNRTGHRSSLEEREEWIASSIVEILESPPTVREELPYAELMDHFTADDQHLIVVLRDERPLGYVTHAALASLLESVDHETFRDCQPVTSGPEYLIVPDQFILENEPLVVCD